MLHLRVNDYDKAYIELGSGTPFVCIHGSLGDFRSWSPVLGPISKHHRMIVPSLRHFFPEHWAGKGGFFTIRQHVADVITFIEGLKVGAVHLMGTLDASLIPAGVAPSNVRTSNVVEAADMIAAGDVDGGLTAFVDGIGGPGTWATRPPAAKQMRRGNAATLIGQVNEQRQPFTRADAEAIRSSTLLIGAAKTSGFLFVVLRALASAIPGAKSVFIPDTTHAERLHDASAAGGWYQ